MSLVKICGITRPQDAEDAFSLGADFLGLVFAPSPRRVDSIQAERIIEAVPTFQNFVGVFQNQEIAEVRRVAERLGLQYVQLHGEESPEYCEHLKKDGLSIIKAIHVNGKSSVTENELKPYNIFAFLFDTKVGSKSGGTGKSFDWNLISPDIWKENKCFLSGGLTPGNIDEAIDATHPFAVDVSSGVESKPGMKDFPLVREFIKKARQDIR